MTITTHGVGMITNANSAKDGTEKSEEIGMITKKNLTKGIISHNCSIRTAQGDVTVGAADQAAVHGTSMSAAGHNHGMIETPDNNKAAADMISAGLPAVVTHSYRVIRMTSTIDGMMSKAEQEHDIRTVKTHIKVEHNHSILMANNASAVQSGWPFGTMTRQQEKKFETI